MRKLFKNLAGKRFGRWQVLRYVGSLRWECRCECGAVLNVLGQSLRRGGSSSCGCGHVYMSAIPIILENCKNVGKEGCWEWNGKRMESGYGTFWHNYRPRSAARYSYEQNVGPIPEGMHILHRCDNPPCCRPDHLFVGTIQDNNADKVQKGRQAKGQSVRKNHEHLRGKTVITARLTAEQVMNIRKRDLAGEPLKELAQAYRISNTQASSIVQGKSWAHLPVLYTGSRSFRPCSKCGKTFSTRGGVHRKHWLSCSG